MLLTQDLYTSYSFCVEASLSSYWYDILSQLFISLLKPHLILGDFLFNYLNNTLPSLYSYPVLCLFVRFILTDMFFI